MPDLIRALGKQMSIFNKIKAGLVLVAAFFATSAMAESGFKVPLHYNLELVDGLDSFDTYSRFSRTLSLTPGRHQVVLTFKDTFTSSGDTRLVQSASPIVIDIMDLKKNQTMTFEYALPTSVSQAETYARTQKITLTDTDGNRINKADATYFIMTSENGFVMGRDYRQELMSLDRLYAPAYVEGSKRGIGMTSYGAPTIEATNNRFDTSTQTMSLDDPGTSIAQESAMSTSSKKGKATGGVSFNQLVKLYNQADDATKLKFVKYVMAN